jgi:LmbE family N-acetylglucosaminyl deacetylase
MVARLKPAVPDAAWPLLLTIRSLAGSGPIVGLPRAARVLALAPHPDDESVGCAGTLRLLASSGAEVTVLFATDGESTRGAAAPAAEVAETRRAEARAACAILGVTPRFGGGPDGALDDHIDALGEQIWAAVDHVRPDVVFVPWWLDGHADHRAVARALVSSPRTSAAELWSYEVWTPLEPNRIVDISAVVEVKERAIAAHRTAHLAFDVSAVLGLNRYRSVHGLMGRGYAEAFYAVPFDEYVRSFGDQLTSR